MKRPRRAPPLLCITGPSGSGKTTLVVSLIAELRSRDVRVAALKHTSHGFQMDRPGKDTFQMKEAGAVEVAAVGGGRIALIADADQSGCGGPEPDPAAIAALLFTNVDLVLAEGFGYSSHPRIEVIGEEPKLRGIRAGAVLAYVARGPRESRGRAMSDLRGKPAPVFHSEEISAIAAFVLASAGLRATSSTGDTRGEAASTVVSRASSAP